MARRVRFQLRLPQRGKENEAQYMPQSGRRCPFSINAPPLRARRVTAFRQRCRQYMPKGPLALPFGHEKTTWECEKEGLVQYITSSALPKAIYAPPSGPEGNCFQTEMSEGPETARQRDSETARAFRPIKCPRGGGHILWPKGAVGIYCFLSCVAPLAPLGPSDSEGQRSVPLCVVGFGPSPLGTERKHLKPFGFRPFGETEMRGRRLWSVPFGDGKKTTCLPFGHEAHSRLRSVPFGDGEKAKRERRRDAKGPLAASLSLAVSLSRCHLCPSLLCLRLASPKGSALHPA